MSEFVRRGLGYKPDFRHLLGVEHRDAAVVLDAAPSPPAEKDNGYQVLDILDQGAAPFCVSHGVMQARRCNQVRNGVVAPRLGSRLWLMYMAHAIDHETESFDGTYVRNGFEVLERLGAPPEAAWPYDDSATGNFRVKPPAEAFREAYDSIAPIDYRRIMSTGYLRVDDVKRALAAGTPVVFGTNVSNDFASNIGTDKPIDPPDGISIAGGHCLVAISYKGDVFKIVNSWSRGWGQDGYCYFTADYLAWPDTVDIWISDFRGTQP